MHFPNLERSRTPSTCNWLKRFSTAAQPSWPTFAVTNCRPFNATAAPLSCFCPISSSCSFPTVSVVPYCLSSSALAHLLPALTLMRVCRSLMRKVTLVTGRQTHHHALSHHHQLLWHLLLPPNHTVHQEWSPKPHHHLWTWLSSHPSGLILPSCHCVGLMLRCHLVISVNCLGPWQLQCLPSSLSLRPEFCLCSGQWIS